MADQKVNRSNKGNPAWKRMSNQGAKARRKASWERGRRRKQERKRVQAELEAANSVRRALGQATPWEVECARRAARRHGVGEAA